MYGTIFRKPLIGDFMSNKNVVIDLKARKDVDGQTFYVGKVKAPVLIDCSQGAVFLVFVSDKGEEQLQVAVMDNKDADD
jgi:hypothetical protein